MTSETLQFFRAETLCSPPFVLSFGCSQTGPVKNAGVWWTVISEEKILIKLGSVNSVFSNHLSGASKIHLPFLYVLMEKSWWVLFFYPFREHHVGQVGKRDTGMGWVKGEVEEVRSNCVPMLLCHLSKWRSNLCSAFFNLAVAQHCKWR